MKRRVREEEEVGELNIVPYLDIVTNLLMFMLLSMVGLISLGVLDVGTPKIGEPDSASAGGGPATEQLNLTVAITDRGFYVAGAGGVLGGEEKTGGGINTAGEPTVPKKNKDYDYAGLTARLSEIKKTFPNESRVIMVAEMNTMYDVIIQTMDATREETVKVGETVKTNKLFPEVWLSAMY